MGLVLSASFTKILPFCVEICFHLKRFFSFVCITKELLLERCKRCYSIPLAHYHLPWQRAKACRAKTNKAQLGRELDKLVQPMAEIPSPSVYMIDGMALVQKLKVSDQMTFGQIADTALSHVLQEGCNSKRIGVVFDVYNDISIKSAERERREGESATYKNLTAGQKIKQFRNFL